MWKRNKRGILVKYITKKVSCDIERIWKKAFFLAACRKEVIRLARNYNEKNKNIKKIPKAQTKIDKIKKEFFDQANSILFYIYVCKCLNYEQFKCFVKIPSVEQNCLANMKRNWQ